MVRIRVRVRIRMKVRVRVRVRVRVSIRVKSPPGEGKPTYHHILKIFKNYTPVSALHHPSL